MELDGRMSIATFINTSSVSNVAVFFGTNGDKSVDRVAALK
jgi:hypothetical protein